MGGTKQINTTVVRKLQKQDVSFNAKAPEPKDSLQGTNREREKKKLNTHQHTHTPHTPNQQHTPHKNTISSEL